MKFITRHGVFQFMLGVDGDGDGEQMVVIVEVEEE